MLAIYKKELRGYFTSMTGYIVVAIMLLVTALCWVWYNILNNMPLFLFYIMQNLLFWVSLIFCISFLTMRSFAEERKTKTDQMLLTYPVSVRGIVIGKYLSMVTVIAIPVLVMNIFPVIMAQQQPQYLTAELCSIFALFLMCCMFIALGMFFSSLVSNVFLSALYTFLSMSVLYLMSWLLQLFPTNALSSLYGMIVIALLLTAVVLLVSKNKFFTIIFALLAGAAIGLTYYLNSGWYENLLPNILGSFNVTAILANFSYYQVLDIGGLVLFISVTFLFVFLTVQSIQKRRYN